MRIERQPAGDNWSVDLPYSLSYSLTSTRWWPRRTARRTGGHWQTD